MFQTINLNPQSSTNAYSTIISGVDSNGDIYGEVYGEISGFYFYTSKGEFYNLGSVVSSFLGFSGVNNNGEAVGNYEDASANSYGLIINNGVATTFNVPGAQNTTITGINDSGEIVGWYQSTIATGGNEIHGFVDINGQISTVDFPGSKGTEITGVNDAGVIVGYFDAPTSYGTTEPFVFQATPACFMKGVRIRTQEGEVAVEDLKIGDIVVTASGTAKTIKWIGRRAVDCSRYNNPTTVWPIRIAAGAFAENAPSRDLWLSPGHNIAFDGALMPIGALQNGKSVVQVERASVQYWHVELECHDILLAEGLPAESYLDTGNRAAFENSGTFIEAYPDFQPKHWAETCLTLVTEGSAVVAAKARLLKRLGEKGHLVETEANAHVLIDGLHVEPIRLSETRLAFALPPGGREIVLYSRTFIPANSVAESNDLRTLGLCIGDLQIDGTELDLAGDDVPSAGWHEPEFAEGRFSHRWTTGTTPLPAGAQVVIVEFTGRGYYWSTSETSVAVRA